MFAGKKDNSVESYYACKLLVFTLYSVTAFIYQMSLQHLEFGTERKVWNNMI